MAESRHLVSEEITNALMDLMAEKPFTEITVTDVVNRAGVARASFYRNFSSTGEILDLVLGDLSASSRSMPFRCCFHRTRGHGGPFFSAISTLYRITGAGS